MPASVELSLHGRRFSACWLAAALAGCASLGPDGPRTLEQEVQAGVERSPSPVALPVCHGYGCYGRTLVTLSAAEWREVRAMFSPPPADGTTERARIAETVGLLERMIGPKTGTAGDLPGTPFAMNDLGQLDCVDESINTSTYLHLMEQSGLLRYNTVRDLRRRTRFFGLAQHYTAVVEDKATGRQYAIDSWFHANGKPAEVVELDRWLAGWDPGDDVQAARRD
ncbi:MAG: hypothetical protein ACREUW_00860 [Burkholderiales bacterium]